MTNPMGKPLANPLRSEAARSFAILLARLALGATLLTFGVAKIGHTGVQNFVDHFTHYIPSSIPLPIGQTCLYILPFAEVILGSLLILGLFTRTTACLAALMVLTFTLAVTGPVARDTPADWPYIHPYIVYLALSILLSTTGPGVISLDRRLHRGKT